MAVVGLLLAMLAAFGALWLYLMLRKVGFYNAVEHLGLTLVAWARSQRWAQDVRRAEYESLALTVQARPAELARIAGQ